jgi:PAS domain S-box-containing protein
MHRGTSGVPDGPTDAPSRTGWVLDAITMVGGFLCVALGLTVMVAWLARATAVLRLGSQHPMSFNTALAVAVTGVALVALVQRRPWAALIAGVFDAALGILTLAEWALGRGLGIDQLIVRAYLGAPHEIPGRPPIITATCLVVIGAGLLLAGPWRASGQPAALAVAGSVVGGIAITSLVAYAFGAPAADVWLRGTAMALLTAVAVLVLALSLLSAAGRETYQSHLGLPRWLPVPAGVAAYCAADIVWLAIVGRAAAPPHISTFTNGSLISGFLTAGLVALAVWLAQQAEGRRQIAVAAATRFASAEKSARESESRLFQFLDAMPVGVFVSMPDGKPYYANQEAVRMLGKGVIPDARVDSLAETYNAFVAGTDRLYPGEDLPVVLALRGRPSHVSDIEIHHPDGGVIPIEVWGRPMYGASGQVDYALATFADMSERYAREKVVADQAALLDSAHDAILLLDKDSRIVYWNRGAEHTYGYTRAEAVGRFAHDLLHTTFPIPVADIETMVARDARWEGELIHRCADGRTIAVESRWVGQHGPDGSLVKILEVNRDVTARNEAERDVLQGAEKIQELNKALEQQVRQRTVHLERANNNLATFTYSIAHDLRTPLRAISGFAEVLAEEYGDSLGEAGSGYAERIQAATEHMSILIDSLQFLSRVSRAEMNLQNVDLSAEVTVICDRLHAGDPDRRVRVRVEEGVRVVADRNLLLIVLENLLKNAWKFTAPRGDATIEFATTVVDGVRCCYVRDNGVGFDFAYADKLFQPFQRLHAGSEFPGTGVGLAAVQRIIERHGGRTWAEGSTGQGATFYFTINATSPSETWDLARPAVTTPGT